MLPEFWPEAIQAAVWPQPIVLDAPLFQNMARFFEAGEPLQVQALVPHLAIEGLDMSVLCRLARFDEQQAHAVLVDPGVQGVTGELGAIVGLNDLRPPPHIA